MPSTSPLFTANNMAVQYFDSDFSFDDHARECAADFEHTLQIALADSVHATGSSDCDGDGDIDIDTKSKRQVGHLHPSVQSGCWDAFHSSHSHGNFFKSRRYITKCFPCLLDQPSNTRRRVILEIGCGSGSSCVPVLQQLMSQHPDCGDSPPFALLACDSSSVAVETTSRCVQEVTNATMHILPETLAQCFNCFVADPSMDSNVSLLERTKEAYREILSSDTAFVGADSGGGIADVILCVFVLSAVDPAHAETFVRQLYQTTKPGGTVAFRDYGVFDLPMMRFPPKAYRSSAEFDFDGRSPRLFCRGDGTLARFFHCETIQKLFEEAGFTEIEELRYATVFNHNRKTKQKMKRVFVHGIFRKPVATPSLEE